MSELTQTVVVNAPAAVVWHDLTDAAALASWFWPARLEATARTDPRAGGVWEIRSEIADMAVIGSIAELAPAEMIGIHWRWEGEESTTDVAITLASVSSVTTDVTVHHRGFTSAEQTQAHVQGWADCLQRLVDRHASGRPLS